MYAEGAFRSGSFEYVNAPAGAGVVLPIFMTGVARPTAQRPRPDW